MTRKKKNEVSTESASNENETDSNEEQEKSGEGTVATPETAAEPAREEVETAAEPTVEATAEPEPEPEPPPRVVTLESVKEDLERLFANANAEGKSARGNAIARAMFIVDEAINTR